MNNRSSTCSPPTRHRTGEAHITTPQWSRDQASGRWWHTLLWIRFSGSPVDDARAPVRTARRGRCLPATGPVGPANAGQATSCSQGGARKRLNRASAAGRRMCPYIQHALMPDLLGPPSETLRYAIRTCRRAEKPFHGQAMSADRAITQAAQGESSGTLWMSFLVRVGRYRG